MKLLLDVSVTVAPPAGAAWFRVTVHTSLAPGTTVGELQVTDEIAPGVPGAVQENAKDCEVPFSDAVTLPLPELVIDPAVRWNEVSLSPAATTTEVGTVRSAPAPFNRVTVKPPVPAGFVRITAHVADPPDVSVAGTHCKSCTPGNPPEAKPNDAVEPLSEAAIVAV